MTPRATIAPWRASSRPSADARRHPSTISPTTSSKHVVLDRPGRRGPGHHRRGELVAEPLGTGDESAQLVVGIAARRPAGPRRGVRLPSSNRRRSVGSGANVFDSCMIPPMAMRMAALPRRDQKDGASSRTRRTQHDRRDSNFTPAIHLSLNATQQVVYCEGTLLVAYSW